MGQRNSGGGGWGVVIAGLVVLALVLYAFFGLGNFLDLTPTFEQISDEKTKDYEGIGLGIVLTLLVIAAPVAVYFFIAGYLERYPGNYAGLLTWAAPPVLALALAVAVLPAGRTTGGSFPEQGRQAASTTQSHISKPDSSGGDSQPRRPKPHPGSNRRHGQDAREPEPAPAAAIPDRAKETTVTSVTDGDTVDFAGLGASRLIGVDTPEVYSGTECFGSEASSYTANRLAPGTTVFFIRGAERIDQYGRDLVYVWLSGGTLFNAELVKAGYATPLAIAPNTDYAGLFDRLAREARSADRGLWPACGGSDAPVGGSGGGAPAGSSSGGGGAASGGGGGCEPGYDPCVPSYPPDVDCADVGGTVSVSGSDPHYLDGDGDGSGCE